jgi:hypothetical protein
MVNNSTNIYQQNKQSPLNNCLEVIICFIDISGIVDQHCLEVIVCFVDIGGIVDHHCLEVIVCFVDIGRVNINKTNNHL